MRSVSLLDPRLYASQYFRMQLQTLRAVSYSFCLVQWLRTQNSGVQPFGTHLHSTCVTLGKLLNLSGLPVPLDLENGAGTNTYLGALLRLQWVLIHPGCRRCSARPRKYSPLLLSQHLASISDCMLGSPDNTISIPG